MNSKYKSLFLFIVFVSISVATVAQTVPYGINYQAVARNSEGYPIANTEIVLEISILKGASNEIVWQETHIGTSDKFGLLNVVIGQGLSTFVGTETEFKNIDWEADEYFVKVRADFGDEDFVNGMVDLGTTPLQSVPYALVAAKALEAPLPNLSDVISANETNLNLNDGIAWNGTNWQAGGFFLARNGSTDLTGDWTISSNNISLTSGILTANAFKTNASLGATINEFSTLTSLGTSDAKVPTQNAVKTYVDNRETSIKTYVDNEFDARWSISGDNKFLYSTKGVGIGTASPLNKLHVETGYSGFMVAGSLKSDEVVNTKTGSVMMFFPSKAAFRAGEDEVGNWAGGNLGIHSAAFGKNTQAYGGGSFAYGYNNTASGTQSFAGGHSNVADQPTSVALGQNSEAYGRSSFVMGEHLISESYLETVFGRFNQKKFSPGPHPTQYQVQDLLFVIGYGNSDSDRKNAFTVMKDGNIGVKTNTSNPPTSSFVVEGSEAHSVLKVTANVNLDETHNVILVDATAGSVSVNLPTDLAMCKGRNYTIKKIDASGNNVAISGGTNTIDNLLFQNLTNQWDFITIINDGNQWYIIGKN